MGLFTTLCCRISSTRLFTLEDTRHAFDLATLMHSAMISLVSLSCLNWAKQAQILSNLPFYVKALSATGSRDNSCTIEVKLHCSILSSFIFLGSLRDSCIHAPYHLQKTRHWEINILYSKSKRWLEDLTMVVTLLACSCDGRPRESTTSSVLSLEEEAPVCFPNWARSHRKFLSSSYLDSCGLTLFYLIDLAIISSNLKPLSGECH